MKIHFTAIGGSVMHQLALVMQARGAQVTGSDDQIYDPARTNLKKQGLLPRKTGWYARKITDSLDAVIVGMHAKPDNPELKTALEKNIPVYAFPAFIAEQIKDKKRVVIAGSHGKTTITAMLMHVLREAGIDFDYLIGAQLQGFERMVQLSEAPLILLEGDEYLSAPFDKQPKFWYYKPHLSLISGIAWDHINVFPKFEDYLGAFRTFLNKHIPGASVTYFEGDKQLSELVEHTKADIQRVPYKTHPYRVREGRTWLKTEAENVPLHFFGPHNMANVAGALQICRMLDIPATSFYKAITTYRGVRKRLECLGKNDTAVVFKDFAHAPSKLQATIEAVKSQYPDRKIVACIELHTYSSLTPRFLSYYRDTTRKADKLLVYTNPETARLKDLPPIKKGVLQRAFGRQDVHFFEDSQALYHYLTGQKWRKSCLLLMSSGNFDNLDLKELATFVLKRS